MKTLLLLRLPGCLLSLLSLFISTDVRAAGLEALPQPPLYERYIAIDNVCAWPRLNRLPDGRITALIWPRPKHGVTEGAVECWTSADGGRMWRKTGVPVPNAPGTNRMNHAGGVLPDGSYLAIVSGYSNRLPGNWVPTADEEAHTRAIDYYRGIHFSQTLKPIPAISHDGGATWKEFGAIEDPADPGFPPAGRTERHIHIIPYGRICKLPDGQIGAMFYSRNLVHFMTSGDGGQTWSERSLLTREKLYNETTFMPLRNGDLYAIARAWKPEHIDGFRSTDGGRTWHNEIALTLSVGGNGDLTQLADGHILLSFATRNDGLRAIGVRYADATARNWAPPLYIADLAGSTDRPTWPNPSRDGGYPSTVEMADGSLVTAYYSRGVPDHMRYHLGVVIWKKPPPDAIMGP